MSDLNFEARIKHLEFLQHVIGRMSEQGNSAKNHCLTLVAGLLGLAAAIESDHLALASALIIASFMVINAYYLRIERNLRSQYDHVRLLPSGQPTDLKIDVHFGGRRRWLNDCFSWSVMWFYLPLLVTSIIVSFIM